MKEIPLTKGYFTIIDDEDYELVSQRTWCANSDSRKNHVYAMGWFQGRGHIKLHRHLLGLKKGDGKVVDHINGDTLDNRRANLRITDVKGNNRNTRLRRQIKLKPTPSQQLACIIRNVDYFVDWVKEGNDPEFFYQHVNGELT